MKLSFSGRCLCAEFAFAYGKTHISVYIYLHEGVLRRHCAGRIIESKFYSAGTEQLTDREQKAAAEKCFRQWNGRGDEKSDTQPFWN